MILGTDGGGGSNKPAAAAESPESVPAEEDKAPVTESEKKEPEDRPEPSGTRRGFKPVLPDSNQPTNEGKLPARNPSVEPAKAGDAEFVPSPIDSSTAPAAPPAPAVTEAPQ